MQGAKGISIPAPQWVSTEAESLSAVLGALCVQSQQALAWTPEAPTTPRHKGRCRPGR